jgi:hypothetical protein
LLLYKNLLVNINRICVFAFVFNIYIKNSIISAIKNIKYILIYTNLFATSKDNINKKEAVSFYIIAFITSTIKKYRNYTLNLASRESVFFFSSNASNII